MDAPIFVVGTGRSGTTLLQLMLCAHPRIHVTFEASFYEWLRVFSGRGDFIEYYVQTHSFRWLGVDPEVARGAARPADAFAAILRAAAAKYGKVRFGDKTPLHSRHLAEIFADFPDARVVHITRDPRGAALSLARMPWAPPTLYAGAAYCELDRRWVAPFRSRILQIRLEDLLADAKTTMARVLEHVGEPWDDAVLDHAHHLADTPLMPPFPWLESAGRDRAAPSAQWQGLSPLELRMIESLARRVMLEHHYEPAQLAREPGRLAVYWLGLRQLPETFRALLLLRRLSRLLRDPARFDDPAVAALFRRLNPAAWKRHADFVWPLPPAAGALQLATRRATTR